MNIPINGRIAIIDDKYEHAYPLMELFGKHKFPFLYYNGNLSGLPEEGMANNDIRVLFLDIYLTGDASRTEKEIVSTLIPVINRVISENNYPYLLIFWSRHDREHGTLVQNMFNNELKNKAPINFLSLQKTDYFELTGEKTVLHNEKIPELLERIRKAINDSPVYGNLMAWENLVHRSADHTLGEIFRINQAKPDWNANSNYLFYKLASSFSGKNFKSLGISDQIKNAFYALNFVFNDSLEYAISSKFQIAEPSQTIGSVVSDGETVYVVNKKLLFADEYVDRRSPGIVSKTKPELHGYEKLLHSAINIHKVFDEHKATIWEKIKDIIDEKILKKTRQKTEKAVLDEFKDGIYKSWITIEANVTPICDFVQDKEEYSRLLPGLLIERKYKAFIDSKSEALFISPDFKLSVENEMLKADGLYFMLLDFRFLYSIPRARLIESMNPILRLRQQLLTEVQSKLGRHINRQGILFLEE